MSDDRPEPPDIEAAKRLARQLGAGAKPPDEQEGPVDPEPAEGGLRLDKDGTLVGRPKLTPVKALRDESEAGPAAPETDPASTETKAPEDAPRRAVLPPKRAALRPEGFVPPPPEPESPVDDDAALLDTGDEVEIPRGEFLFGDDGASRFLGSFHIDRFPVKNRDYARFVSETFHRPPLYWKDGVMPPSLAEHPVVGVDYFDALAYAQWVGKDLPFEDEWERAARGCDGRTYPWGDETEFNAANTARVELKMTTPVSLYKRNVSPDGCRDMVGNVWELTHSPAAGGGVVVRGGSWYDFALYAKTYFRFATAPSARNGTIGFRCVRRHEPRPDEPREVDPAIVEAEIASRRGSQPPIDAAEFSAERRDLVLEPLRLNTYVHEVESEALAGTLRPRPQPTAPDDADAPSEDVPQGDMPPAQEPSLADLEALRTQEDVPEGHPVEPDLGTGDPASVAEPDAGPTIRFGSVPPPAAGVEPAAGGRVHVDPSLELAAEAVAQSERMQSVDVAVAKARSMPWAMWALLAGGFALFGALLVSLLTSDPTNDPPSPPPATDAASETATDPATEGRPPTHDPVWDRLPPFPDYGKGVSDGEQPRIVDAADEEERGSLEQGTWALFFVDPDTDAGATSLSAIHRLHRRVVGRGLTVAVVLDRARFAVDGKLEQSRALFERLEAYRLISDGMTVVFDPADARGDGLLKATLARRGKALYATLLHDGVTESRTRPPRSAPGFQMQHLAPLVKRALALVPEIGQ